MIFILLVILLLLICVLEAVLLFRDHGIFASYVQAAREMAHNVGIFKTLSHSVHFAFGVVKSFFPMKRIMTSEDKLGDLTIAFAPTGGLGDYIISAVVLEEIMHMCDCKIDVYVEKMSFGQAVYRNRKNVNILQYSKFEANRKNYDLALLVEHFVHVKNYDEGRLQKFALKLYDSVKYIVDNWDALYVNIPEQCWRERIQFERCRTLGLDRWTELRMGKAFAVLSKKVYIPMDEEYKRQWEERSAYLGKYVTINYGADAMRPGLKQLKLWPKKNLIQLVSLIHEKCPDVKVIQLGGSDAEKITGVDVYVLGESIELTKWILKNSAVHIDCEGGLVHLATQLGTKCIVVFGPTPVHMYGYKENINLVNDECSNCMGLHGDWAYECFANCDGKCMSNITAKIALKSVQECIS